MLFREILRGQSGVRALALGPLRAPARRLSCPRVIRACAGPSKRGDSTRALAYVKEGVSPGTGRRRGMEEREEEEEEGNRNGDERDKRRDRTPRT